MYRASESKVSINTAIMQLYAKSKLRLRQLLGHELTSRIELDCKTFTAGEWAFSPIGINRGSVIISLGIANDIQFDKGIINGFGCHVYAFDPAPKWIDRIKEQQTLPEFHIHPYAIGAKEGSLRIAPHALDNRRTSSPMRSPGGGGTDNAKTIDVPVKSISTVMSEIGVKHIDILKMDIGAAEYAVIDDVLDSGIQVYQMLVEFHHRFKTVPIEKTKAVLKKLDAAGYRIFHISENYQGFSFIHEKTYAQYCRESMNNLWLKPGVMQSALSPARSKRHISLAGEN
jgi:FkbM family methyltransferase